MSANNTLKDEIADYVERMVLNEGLTYLEACLDAMDVFHLDYNQFSHNLSPALRSKLENEATIEGHIKGGSKPMVTF